LGLVDAVNNPDPSGALTQAAERALLSHRGVPRPLRRRSRSGSPNRSARARARAGAVGAREGVDRSAHEGDDNRAQGAANAEVGATAAATRAALEARCGPMPRHS